MPRKSAVKEFKIKGEPFVKYKKSGKVGKMTKAEFESCIRKVKGTVKDPKAVCGAVHWGSKGKKKK